MAPSSRRDYGLNLGLLPQPSLNQPASGSSTAATSPIDHTMTSANRYPVGSSNGQASTSMTAAGSRLGAGSPSHEYGSRLFPKRIRAREIQAQEGLGTHLWGPPTSGTSTPLRETIPESPDSDSFPDFGQPPTESMDSPASGRRLRAGTVPSKFPGAVSSTSNTLTLPSPSLQPKTSRPTPSTSPFRPGPSVTGNADATVSATAISNTSQTLLSRLRAGSMPQRASLLPSSTPFGPSVFSTNWNTTHDRASLLTSSKSSNGPPLPAQSTISKDSLAEGDVRTLDYLGLADGPQQGRANLSRSELENTLSSVQQDTNVQAVAADFGDLNKNSNRLRSFSVNAKEKYADEEDGDYVSRYSSHYGGSLTPSAEATAAALAVTQAQIHQHNLAVQAYVNQATANRPRARTAGVLDFPLTRQLRSNYVASPSRLDGSTNIVSQQIEEGAEYDDLADAVQGVNIGATGDRTTNDAPDEGNLEGPTRALWLGGIPASTTVSSLQMIFSGFGKIDSVRILPTKNCAFINFKNLESAVQAKGSLSGKELFPGHGTVRFGYAKEPSASSTPGYNGTFPSPSPDSLAKPGDVAADVNGSSSFRIADNASGLSSLPMPNLRELRFDILQIVRDFGASDEESMHINSILEKAINNSNFDFDIPAVPESNHHRLYDAPRLREIRKRIDNQTISQAEIEETAIGMLREIVELSSDYLGNTVVQKLFEFCSESVKQAMLTEISPHLAEIGIHKNGTWAAQKMIDVARTPAQMSAIVDALRPYGVACLHDQFGNYVIQCCLRFQSPLNDFIFEIMLSRLWLVAQGRFSARAVRACLESHFATKDQQRMVAAAVALHSVQLATNPNGALLLTWFLDTCTFPRRRTVLAPKLIPHLAHLCTHKVAYLTVLKIVNQRNEPEARDLITKAIFFSENNQVLEDILRDPLCGATLVFKIITTPFLEEKLRSEVVQNVRSVLQHIKAQPSQGYKRLMDEVGLSTRTGSVPNRGIQGPREFLDGFRPGSKHGFVNGHAHQPSVDRPLSGYYPGVPPQQFDPSLSLQRSNSFPSNGVTPYNFNNVHAQGFTPNLQNNVSATIPPMTPQQLQYQQALLNASTGVGRPPAFYAPANPGYPSPAPTIDPYRHSVGSPMQPQMNPSPIGMGGGFAVPQGFMPGMAAGGMPSGVYGLPQMHYMAQGQQMGGMGAGRRGRR